MGGGNRFGVNLHANSSDFHRKGIGGSRIVGCGSPGDISMDGVISSHMYAGRPTRGNLWPEDSDGNSANLNTDFINGCRIDRRGIQRDISAH